MLAVRLPKSIEKRLEELARRTGRTKTYHVREAIRQHLDDLEDIYFAEYALKRIRSGKMRTVPLKDVVLNVMGPRATDAGLRIARSHPRP
jgi:RHH-type rel operon transcriptional repressor/antitoxin RelB